MKFIVTLIAILFVLIVSVPASVVAQSSSVEATAVICGLDVKAYNSVADRTADNSLPTNTTVSFGIMEHGATSDVIIFDLRPSEDISTTLRIFATDWNDFDGNFVMNGNQTHVTPRIADSYELGFPLNSTGQYVPDGEGALALPTGSINDARDGVILSTRTSGMIHHAAMSLQVPDDATIIDPAFVGSIHQDLTFQFEC